MTKLGPTCISFLVSLGPCVRLFHTTILSPFQTTSQFLIICALTYFISSWVLQYYQKTWEKDYVLFTKQTATHGKALGIRLAFQLYSDELVVVSVDLTAGESTIPTVLTVKRRGCHLAGGLMRVEFFTPKHSTTRWKSSTKSSIGSPPECWLLSQLITKLQLK
jgi:hypothetical protein